MPNKVIEDTNIYTLINHFGKTKFKGCQCFKDCTCNEDFKSQEYNYYTVKKKFNKPKTTTHNTLTEATIRINFLISLQ